MKSPTTAVVNGLDTPSGCLMVFGLGFRASLGDCYLDGITFSFMFWKDVLGFSYLGVILLSGLHLIYQALRWVLNYLQGLVQQGGESG